jgi:glycosyltransferase involved in cell wall biosynthesis
MLKSNLPRISIVTPSYYQGEYLEETICSVLDQNYTSLEYIIIDGGSSDHSVDIIKKYQKHFTYWLSELDNGQSDALNNGLQKCTGHFFNWINSDDYLEPGA